jgi:hypothetical protein
MIPAIGIMKPVGKSGVDLLTGLQAYWKFEESSGTLYDSHGSKNFIPSGSFTYQATGKNNYCIYPPDLYPYAYTNSGLGSSIGNLSISMWVNFSFDELSLFTIGRYNETNHLAIKIENRNLISYLITKSGYYNVWDECTTSNISEAWHHIAFLRDITNGKQELYVDGNLEESVTSLNIDSSLNVSDKFYLYDYALSSLSQFNRYYTKGVNYTHKIDELAIYNIVINSEQIAALANETFYDNF